MTNSKFYFNIYFNVILSFLLIFPFVASAQKSSVNNPAEINGGKIFYETAGTGKAVVFVHGGLVDRRLWDDQFGEFADKYRVIRYDIRGHGRSPMPEKTYSPVEDLYQLLKLLNVEKATIVGLSFGGMIASDFALEHPEMVEKLVLVGAGLRGFEAKPTDEAINFFRELSKAEPEKAAELWMKHEFFAAFDNKPQARARMLKLLAENHRAWVGIEENKYSFPETLTIQRLDRIAAPTLVASAIETIRIYWQSAKF